MVLSRLRRGELLAATGGVLLLVFINVLTWYRLKTPHGWTAATLGVPTSYTGWAALSQLHYLVVLTAALAIALAVFQVSRREPAIPATLSMLVFTLGVVTALALLYRVVISVPTARGEMRQQVGAYLGLASAVLIAWGGFDSLHSEGVRPQDGPAEIELVALGAASGASGEPVPH